MKKINLQELQTTGLVLLETGTGYGLMDIWDAVIKDLVFTGDTVEIRLALNPEGKQVTTDDTYTYEKVC